MHRVVNRSPSTTRHSAVWFCNADFDAPVEVLGGGRAGAPGGGAAEGQQQPQKKVVTAGEYILRQLGLMYA